MGLQIRCYVNGDQEFLDLYPDENIDLEVSFAEIQDITKKNSAFTREFKVPGSKNNNNIFNYFFEINQVFTNWNPKRKFEADLLYDGYEIFQGYVRLNSVSINKLEKVYSITFYSAVGNLVANIGDKALCDVDTSSLNHSLYDPPTAEQLFFDPSLHDPNSYNTQNPSTPITVNAVNSGDVQYILGQRGYDYTGSTFNDIRDINVYSTPLLDFSGVTGFFDFSGTPIISSYLIPSIRTRKLYELIVNQAGYNIESEFFNSDYFARYYIPLSFNTEQPFMAQSQPYKYKWVNTSGETTSFLQEVRNPPSMIRYFTNWILPQEIVEQNFNINPIDYSLLPPNLLSQQQVEHMFALPGTLDQEYTFKATITTKSTGTFGVFPYEYSGGKLQLWRFRQNLGIIYAQLIKEQDYVVNTQAPNREFTTTMTGTTTSTGQIYGNDLFFLSYYKNSLPFVVTGASFEITSGPTVLPPTIELFREMSCDQKQIDFIQNINKAFNLVVVEHPFKPKTLIVEPMIDYIGKGQTLDWTSKVDYDATQNLYPTTNLINGSIFASNTADKDYINTEYTKRANKTFGQNIFDLNIDYKNETTELVQGLGQNTDYYMNSTGDVTLALPCYFITKENNNNGISTFEYRPFRSLPRQVFMSVNVPTGNTESNPFFYRYDGTSVPFTVIGLVSMGTYQNVNRLTTYPYAITGFSHYTIYDSNNVFTQDELIYPELENQYDRYYRDYVEDLIDDENKIYQVKMYLTPWEVASLYYNETILIKNTRFRINKISGLSITEPGLCSVELVKLTRDYTPAPILFYDLISCEDPCDVIHTHTDLIYPIWAFEGQYVDLITTGNTIQRYYIIRTEFNENNTYTKPYFTTYRTQTLNYYIYWDYATYDSCDATTPNFKLTIRDEFTNPYTGTCVSMTITNTGATQETYFYTDCSGITTSGTLDPSSAVTVSGLYSSFVNTGFTYCLDEFTPLPPSPSADCRINTTFLVTNTGWVKYTLCDQSQVYRFYNTLGSKTITDCIVSGSVQPGFPYSDLAVFTITSIGTSC